MRPRAVRFSSVVVTITDCKLLTGWGEVMVSRIFTSWNHLGGWLRQVHELENVAPLPSWQSIEHRLTGRSAGDRLRQEKCPDQRE